ncbi:MAG TPA: (deoxy)nucleoside triphosphate pyrophosphohydrolase [Nitrospiria bacterium]
MTLTPESRIIEVAAAVIVWNHRVLVTRRPEGTHLGGLWEFPGGKRESDESLADCLRRELKEELDLTVEVDEEITVIRHADAERTVKLYFHRCTILEGTPQPMYGQAVQWADAAELSVLPFPPANRSLVLRLQQTL